MGVDHYRDFQVRCPDHQVRMCTVTYQVSVPGQLERVPIPAILDIAGVHITPVQVGNNGAGGAGVLVTVNGCVSSRNSTAARQALSLVPQARRGVAITPITPSSQPIFIGKALLKAVGKKQNEKAQSGAKLLF